MDGFWHLNLIHFLDFYYSILFLANTMRRWGQYQAVGSMVLASPGRWPRLLSLIKDHRAVFLTGTTLLPGLLALVLSVMQILASRTIWPEVGMPPHILTVEKLAAHPLALGVVIPLGLMMLAVDLYFLLVVGKLDQQEMEKYFDQAEYWLRSRTSDLVRIFTFGRINPRNMVALEVRKALVELRAILNINLWWVIIQVSLRLAFGLSLWGTWILIGP